MSIKAQVIMIFSILLALLSAIVTAMWLLANSHERVALAEQHRFETRKLAHQLRQSSDDLTRMVRTYAATGDPAFEDYFYEILAIRDGKAPRPEDYDRIYWDIVTAGGERPSPFGPPAALIDLMKEIGLTPGELTKLEEAKKNSDDLTRLEAQAFGAMKGLYADGNGELSIKRPPNPAHARAILHSKEYHNAKKEIMRPIGEFVRMIDSRTLSTVKQASAQETKYRQMVIVLVILTILFSLFALFHVQRRVVDPVVRLSRIAEQVESGYLDARADVSTADEIGTLNNAFNQMMTHTQNGIENLEREISERKQAEKEIEVQRDELERLNREKDKFFSIIAHDLKGPFNALLGYSSLMSSGIADLNKDQVAEYGDLMHGSAQQVFKLLENLLEWSRLQRGQMKFEPGPVDVKDVIDKNLELFALNAKEKAIRLTGTRRQSLIVFADAHMVDMIIRNLVNNAIKFTPEMGNVTVSARQNGSWAEVKISDTGVGISADKAIRLFQLDEKTSTAGTGGETGTGLGLLLCKELVEKQGGEINLESIEGEGSTFRITLPPYRRFSIRKTYGR